MATSASMRTSAVADPMNVDKPDTCNRYTHVGNGWVTVIDTSPEPLLVPVVRTVIGRPRQLAIRLTDPPDHAPAVSARVRCPVNVNGVTVVVPPGGAPVNITVDPINVAVRTGLSWPPRSRSHNEKLYVVPGVNPPRVTLLSIPL